MAEQPCNFYKEQAVHFKVDMISKIKKAVNFIIFDLIFFLGGSATFFATPWGLKNYPMQMHWNVFFVLSADTSGHDSGTGRSIIFGFVIPAIVLFIIIKTAFYFYSKKNPEVKKLNWNLIKAIYFLCSVFFLIILTSAWKYINIAKIIKGDAEQSEFYEKNCITSDNFSIIPAQNKRNLIYIFMESMEGDFTSLENGGIFEKNLIPNLTSLAKENVSFSENEGLTGGINLQGTSWTVAGLLSKLYSLPYFLPFTDDAEGSHCLKNVTTLNDVLNTQGYTQIFAMGSEKQFENRDIVLEDHNVEIHDIKWYKENKYLEKDYQVFWGFEDKKLYEIARIELKQLAEKDEPFFYGMLTVDTHFPNGFVCSECKDDTKSQIDNVILCADRQINEFINWIKQQDWYNNTTIIITGDHNYLDAPLNCFIKKESKLKNKEVDLRRRFINIIINPAIDIPVEKQKNRRFSSFDVTPTLLEVIGNKIEGKGMYLGRSLAGAEKTLCELYSQKEIEKEIMKKTVQYEKLKN